MISIYCPFQYFNVYYYNNRIAICIGESMVIGTWNISNILGCYHPRQDEQKQETVKCKQRYVHYLTSFNRNCKQYRDN